MYGIFAVLACLVFIGFPMLMSQCCIERKRVNLSYGMWMFKWTLLSLAGKWMLETYDVVEVIMKENETGKKFDPYKLLHIKNDGSYATPEIETAFHRLASKYHPSRVDASKIPLDKAVKRWENLNVAYETLTDEAMFVNYQQYGHPEGTKTMKVLNAAIPYWVLEEDFRPTLVMWCFVSAIALMLAIGVW